MFLIQQISRRHVSIKQESPANVQVSARQQSMYEGH